MIISDTIICNITKPVERHPTEFYMYVDEMIQYSELLTLISSYLPDETHPFINGII